MKNIKRLLALVLALTMCIATLATVSAASVAWYSRAVDYIESKGIDTIGTKAGQKITRNDFVYWIAKVVTHQVADGAWDDSVLEDEVVFTDVTSAHHIAAIAHSQQLGYLRGDGNNKFYPDAKLTLAELSAIVVRVMGYENKVSGEAVDWKYNYMIVANLYCNAFDQTFMAKTGTADPDYELSYGEAAYVLATIMNWDGVAPESLTADGVDLGAFFNGNTAGVSTYTAVVADLTYVVDYQTNGMVNHFTDIIDTDKNVDLVVKYSDGSTEVVTMAGIDFQGYIRVSQGLNAEVDWRNEEEYDLGDYVAVGSTVSVRVENQTGEIVSIRLLDNRVVDTFGVIKATTSSRYVPFLANSVASTVNYTMELPVGYTEDVHFQFVDVAYAADGTVLSASLKIGDKVYAISSVETTAEGSLAVYDLYTANNVEEALTTPLTADEVYNLMYDTGRGMTTFVLTDLDGDGDWDQAVVTDNYEYIYRSKLNANPAKSSSANEDKTYEMGAVLAGYKPSVLTSLSTDMFGLGDANNEITLIVSATNKRWITAEGAGYLGDDNPNGGHSILLPMYYDVKLPYTLTTAYIESATSLAVDGYYRVVFVNLDGTRTTAYMPFPTYANVTTTADKAEVAVYEIDGWKVYRKDLGNLDETTGWYAYEDLTKDDVVKFKADKEVTGLTKEQVEAKTLADVTKVVEKVEVQVYKIARGWTMYRKDLDTSATKKWYAYEDNDVFAKDEEITTAYLGSTEVAGKYEYVVYDYVPMTTDVTVTIGGLETVVTLDSSTWVPFLTDYVRENDKGINTVTTVEDTAAWMVDKYIKYALDEDGKVLFALPTTKTADEGLIISVVKTDTGDNTYNVTMGVSGGQSTAEKTASYGDSRFSQTRWNGFHTMVGASSSAGPNKYTQNELFDLCGIDLETLALNKIVYSNGSAYGNLLGYARNAVKALGASFAKDLTIAELGNLNGTAKTALTNMLTNANNANIKAGFGVADATTADTLQEVLESRLPEGAIDFDKWVEAITNAAGEAYPYATHGQLYFDIQQAFDVAKGGYWYVNKSEFAPYGNVYASEAFEYKGPEKVITKEVRGAASAVEDWENYAAYHRIFQEGTLVHDIVVDDKLEGRNLSYGRFYTDAGNLAILRYVGELENGEVTHFYQETTGGWTYKNFSANSAFGGNWQSKGVLNYYLTTMYEADSYVPLTEPIQLSEPVMVDGSKVMGANGYDYTANYKVKYAYNPYYLRTATPAYKRYWTKVVTATITGTTTAQEGDPIVTYIPVVDGNNVQIPVTSEADKTQWEALTVDTQGSPVAYKVINNLLFKVNTIKTPFKLDAKGNVVTKTVFDYDNPISSDIAEDVEVKKEEMFSMTTVRALTSNEDGYFPGAYVITFEGKSYVASGATNVVVMAPNFTTGNVTGTVYTVAELAAKNLGVWATRRFVKSSGTSLSCLTVIGEAVSTVGQPVDPGQTQPVDTSRTVYIASEESVVEQLETGKQYVVKSLYSAVELPSGEEVGSIVVPYSTYVEAVAAEKVNPVLTANTFYKIDKDNVVLGLANVQWSKGTITSVTADGKVTGTIDGKEVKEQAYTWKFFYMDFDRTYLAVASANTSVAVSSEADAKKTVTTAQTKVANALKAYQSAVSVGLSAAKVEEYKQAYDAAVAAAITAEETAIAKNLNGTFWGVENSPAYNYLVVGKMTYQSTPTPIEFAYTVIGGTYCVMVNSFFAANSWVQSV